jgi:hypothetical protein
MKKSLLKWLLIISGAFQIVYWGVSHLFFPQWYLRSIGLSVLASEPGETLLFLHEIGILAIGIGIATILAAWNPIRNFAIIIVLYILGIGSMAVSLYHILFQNMASGEIVTVVIIGIQMLLLTFLFPWRDLQKVRAVA